MWLIFHFSPYLSPPVPHSLSDWSFKCHIVSVTDWSCCDMQVEVCSGEFAEGRVTSAEHFFDQGTQRKCSVLKTWEWMCGSAVLFIDQTNLINKQNKSWNLCCKFDLSDLFISIVTPKKHFSFFYFSNSYNIVPSFLHLRSYDFYFTWKSLHMHVKYEKHKCLENVK